MAKTLPVRFCGGCQAAYDRRAYLDDLLGIMADFGEQVIPDYCATPESASAGLLICGCAALCALDDAPLPPGWHVAGPGGSFDHAVQPTEHVARALLQDLEGKGEALPGPCPG